MNAHAIRNDTEARILQSLARDGAQSRADLARRLGVMRSTIGVQARRLLDSGLVREATDVPACETAGVGRPGAAIELNPEHCCFVGVEFSIGRVRALVSDLQGNTLCTLFEAPQPEEQSAEATVDLIARMVCQVAPDPAHVFGISVSVPGIVTADGVVVRIPLLNWKDEPLKAALETALPAYANITLDNDANIFARIQLVEELGSVRPAVSPPIGLGASTPGHTSIYFWMDSGIGSGLALGGHLVSGQTGRAGEVGHSFVRSRYHEGPARLDEVVGTIGLLQRYAQLGGTAKDIDSFVRDYRAGEQLARQVIDEWLGVMGETLATMTSLFDPGAFVFSGPLATLLEAVHEELDRAFANLLLYGTPKPDLVVVAYNPQGLAQGCVHTLRASYLAGEVS